MAALNPPSAEPPDDDPLLMPASDDKVPEPTIDDAPLGSNRSALTLRTPLCGLAMGAADIVPGVSGGTVALILGVYTRLLTALNHVDRRFLSMILARKWNQAADRIDFKFLFLLGSGIAASVIGLSRVMHHLLEHHRELTYATFFGLIAASGVLVAQMTRPKSARSAAGFLALGTIAAVFAAWLAGLSQLAPQPGLAYTFVSGLIAICAMILPGISGAYLLLMLGKYEEITGIIKRAPKLEVTGDEIATLAVFAFGCIVGLLAFSRVLRWLLTHHWSPTMAVLGGFMIGSLRRVWPFQRDTTPDVIKFKQKVFESYVPATWDSDVTACVVAAVIGFTIVLVGDAIARRKAHAVEIPSDAPNDVEP